MVAQHVELVGHGREEGAVADALELPLDQRGDYTPLDLTVVVEKVEQSNLRNCTVRKTHKCAQKSGGAQTQVCGADRLRRAQTRPLKISRFHAK